MLGPSSPIVGSRARSSLPRAATVRSITSAYMRASRCPPGAGTDGFTPMIHAAGFSGTAATTWAAARRKKTTDRSAVGKQCDVMSGKLNVTANQAIRCAVSGNGRRFYTGRTTAEQFEFCGTATAVGTKPVQRPLPLRSQRYKTRRRLRPRRPHLTLALNETGWSEVVQTDFGQKNGGQSRPLIGNQRVCSTSMRVHVSLSRQTTPNCDPGQPRVCAENRIRWRLRPHSVYQ
jgi:hypothetical protein